MKITKEYLIENGWEHDKSIRTRQIYNNSEVKAWIEFDDDEIIGVVDCPLCGDDSFEHYNKLKFTVENLIIITQIEDLCKKLKWME